MPLPLLIVGAVAAGLWGGKKMIDASSANGKARALGEEAADIFDKAKDELDDARERANATLEGLGRKKIEVWQSDIQSFVNIMQQIKDVQISGSAHVDEFAKTLIKPDTLLEMKETSLKLASLGNAVMGSVASGALAGVAAYGGVGALATASTGAAISGLSGVAATNATLAWLGGGSIAAGGAGMAGGMAVLGGVIAGPALLVGGWAMAAKAEANLAKARASYAEAQQAAEEMALAMAAVEGITRVSEQFNHAITQFQRTFRTTLGALQSVIAQTPPRRVPLLVRIFDSVRGVQRAPSYSFKDYTPQQKEIVWLAYECAGVMKRLLETPLLREDGAIDVQCTEVLTLPQVVQTKVSNLVA